MNAEFYQLANQLTADSQSNSAAPSKRLSGKEISRYSDTVLARIHASEKQNTIADRQKHCKTKGRAHRMLKYTAAAACTALLLCATVFSEDAHAAIEHISWSISSALSLPDDLANYCEVINTSAVDKGYVITLQEVVAADEKLVVNYTIQREDGQSMGEIPAVTYDRLYINGIRQFGGASGGSGFLDDAHTAVGISWAFDIENMDMAKENTYRLHVNALQEDTKDAVKGSWDFSFCADGSELIADTVRIPIKKEFTPEEGITITLEELTLNELEQRVSYRVSNSTDKNACQLLRIDATDSTGKQVQFETKVFDSATGDGYMQNAEILLDGRIDPTAKTVAMTLYATSLPEESGQMSNDYTQVGEPFELRIQ